MSMGMCACVANCIHHAVFLLLNFWCAYLMRVVLLLLVFCSLRCSFVFRSYYPRNNERIITLCAKYKYPDRKACRKRSTRYQSRTHTISHDVIFIGLRFVDTLSHSSWLIPDKISFSSAFIYTVRGSVCSFFRCIINNNNSVQRAETAIKTDEKKHTTK